MDDFSVEQMVTFGFKVTVSFYTHFSNYSLYQLRGI